MDDWVLHIAAMERLGASVRDLADETYESILGYPGNKDGTGHKPSRPDIQKMKDIADLWTAAQNVSTGEVGEADPPEGIAARNEWNAKYGLDQREISAISLYKYCYANANADTYHNAEKAFEFATKIWSEQLEQEKNLRPGEELMPSTLLPEVDLGGDLLGDSGEKLPEPSQEAKKFVGNALKKYELQNMPILYNAIHNAMENVYRRGPFESYKLWPRMVGWIKDDWKSWLMNPNNSTFNRANMSHGHLNNLGHIEDLTREGGKILDELRRENKLPQNFDVNKVNFKDFEDWLMQWKHENLASENSGEVVYKFHNGWTMQKLTTEAQLQYEGDEMGHCVGGYFHEVDSGKTIIYSLRDEKDVPHVTVEMDALEGPLNVTGGDGSDLPEDAVYNHEPIHPEHDPGEHVEEKHDNHSNLMAYKPTGDTPFSIVQIQGNSNRTPKTEYQHMIKEWLDSLRAKGWKFERSDNWYAPYDEGDDHYEEGINDAQELDDWYDNAYKTHHEHYQSGKEDAYGMPADRRVPQIGDWGEIFNTALYSLVDEYDRGRWTGARPDDLAQAVYHAWMLDTYKDHLSPNQLKIQETELRNRIEQAESTMDDWQHQILDGNWEVIRQERYEKFEDLAKAKGVWDAIYDKADAMFEEDPSKVGDLESEIANIAEEEHEDLWMQALEEAESQTLDSYSGEAWRFLNYLYNLLEHHGAVNPADLPNPNDQHGGLKSRDELLNANQMKIVEAQPTGVEQGLPGTFSSWREADVKHPVEIHPIDMEHNVWFDTDGNQRARFRPGWSKNPETGRMEQTGELEDTFLDKHGRQGNGWVAYNDDVPVGSLTYVDQDGWHMIGTAYTHPDFREQGIFNQLAAPLRATGQPIDAYVWDNPWLKNKVRSWR